MGNDNKTQQPPTPNQQQPKAGLVTPPLKTAATTAAADLTPTPTPRVPVAPPKGAVLLHIHTSDAIETHVLENSLVVRLRARFGKGPGFEKWLLTVLRNLAAAA